MKRLMLAVVALLSLLLAGAIPASGHPNDEAGEGKDAPALEQDDNFPTLESIGDGVYSAPCVGGLAGYFPCDDVNLSAFLPMDAIGGGRGSDVWGWTDPETERRYVIAGRDNGTAFLDVTNERKPVYLGNLPTSGTQVVIWRDIKVYADHAFIVSESRGHGMQVFDLRQLRTVDRAAAPVEFEETALYQEFGRAHNIAINEDTGFAYAVGNREDLRSCRGGLHMIDIRQPASPTFAGCFSEDGYVHDTQCVVYDGPDADYAGREICLNSNEDTLTISDVTDKSAPVMVSRTPYLGQAYTHQGWLTEDRTRFLMGDEADELRNGVPTTTYVWDVTDLDAPALLNAHEAETTAIDHNMYVDGNLVFQSNYRSGLRILALDDVDEGELTEVGYFDTWPADELTAFSHGTWSNYPFFDNGLVVVHGYDGLFLVRPTLPRR